MADIDVVTIIEQLYRVIAAQRDSFNQLLKEKNELEVQVDAAVTEIAKLRGPGKDELLIQRKELYEQVMEYKNNLFKFKAILDDNELTDNKKGKALIESLAKFYGAHPEFYN